MRVSEREWKLERERFIKVNNGAFYFSQLCICDLSYNKVNSLLSFLFMREFGKDRNEVFKILWKKIQGVRKLIFLFLHIQQVPLDILTLPILT